jgi:CheY-like chemotaxis protein
MEGQALMTGAPPVDSKSRRILMLEDEVQFASLLKELLTEADFEVVIANDGVQGLKKVMAADFDVILCDMMMPSLAGDMFYMAVERTKPHLCKRFIFMTGHRRNPRVESFIRDIRGRLLWKPFPFEELMEAIRDAATRAI